MNTYIATTVLSWSELDYFVAKAAKRRAYIDAETHKCFIQVNPDRWVEFSPSTLWTHGGPIIENMKISIEYDGIINGKPTWCSYIGFNQYNNSTCADGQTPLEAAMRTVVLNSIGTHVNATEILNLCGEV